MVPERLADAISKVLKSKKFSPLYADNWLATCQMGVFNLWTETREPIIRDKFKRTHRYL